jgi:hypothetical protein
MDWEGWIFTVALLFCIFSFFTYESTEKEKCDIIHPAGAPIKNKCERY